MTSPDLSGLIERVEADGPVDILLANLNERQKAFILKMKPHAEPQRMSALDWESIDPCVDLGEDVWPNTFWFGGMRLTWVNGRAKRTFCFNADGLDVHASLRAQKEQANG